MSCEITLTRESDTLAFAKALGSIVRVGDLIYLNGTLGAGKSTLARGLIRALAPRNEANEFDVPSPTFTLVQTYDDLDVPVWHFDLYRLESPDEIYEIGIEDALSHAVSLIEWPERLGTLRLGHPLSLTLKIIDDTSRLVICEGNEDWMARLREIGYE